MHRNGLHSLSIPTPSHPKAVLISSNPKTISLGPLVPLKGDRKKKGDRLSLGLWNDRTADSIIRCVSTYLMPGFVLLMRLFW